MTWLNLKLKIMHTEYLKFQGRCLETKDIFSQQFVEILSATFLYLHHDKGLSFPDLRTVCI